MQQALFWVAIVTLVFAASECAANTALPSSWTTDTDLSYGTCTVAPIAGLEKTSPPYTGANTNPLIAEAVGYSPIGNTCNFRGSGNTPLGVLNSLPLWQQEYAAALAQDLYAGFHLPQSNSAWMAACAVNQISQSQAASGTGMCRSDCGVCFLVSGPSGSAVFFGNEIADYDAVGQNAIGINVHMFNGANGHISSVRTWSGVSKDIAIKRVPCPVGNTGIQVYWYANYGGGSTSEAVYFTILNHRTEVKTVMIRAAEGTGGDQSWKPLVADWTNRWHFETYSTCASNGCATWQIGWGDITRGSTTKQFELQITDVFGASVICRNLVAQNTGAIADCLALDNSPVQLPIPNVAITPCNGASYTTVANINFYSSAELAPTTGASTVATPSAATNKPSKSQSPSSVVKGSKEPVKTKQQHSKKPAKQSNKHTKRPSTPRSTPQKSNAVVLSSWLSLMALLLLRGITSRWN